MLTQTFIHIPNVSRQKEGLLWRNQIYSWDDFLENYQKLRQVLSENMIGNMIEHVTKSKKEYEEKNHLFFSNKMDIKDHWRAYNCFDNICFLDIETTGLSKEYNNITTIAVYDGSVSHVYIQGKNLDEFPRDIAQYSTIVTFNGRCFDLPFIKAKFPGLEFNQFHIDLRFVMRDLGHTGGLKNIEKRLNINRSDEVAGVDGYEAVRLWKRYQRGDNDSLKKLIAYNIADVENLKLMMDMAFEMMVGRYFPFVNNLKIKIN